MCIIGTSCRRGTSTVFGVMIFVGIMFTAVIPMLLLMNQANTLYELRKVEVGRIDEERAIENMYFYLLPTIDGEPIITLKISNRCEIAVRIIHVWINDELREVDLLISPISNGELELMNLIDPEDPDPIAFSIMIVTDKGNIFLPNSGTPTYDPFGDGSWEMDFYTIYIMMLHPQSQLHILVKMGETVYFDYPVDNEEQGYAISVQDSGTYQIVVTKLLGKPSEEELENTERYVDGDSPLALVIV